VTTTPPDEPQQPAQPPAPPPSPPPQPQPPPTPPAGGGAAYQPPQTAQTNGLAIASLVSSIAGFFCGVGYIVGIVLGFIAMNQIDRSGGTQQGRGLALAGVIIGFVCIGIGLLVLIIVIIASAAA
jgi:Domain of unknown function (DUF4190)